MDLIPSGMMHATLESYMIRITSRSRVIYLIIIVLIISCLAILPFVYVDVAVRARGVFEQGEILNTDPESQDKSSGSMSAICFVKPENISLIERDHKIEIEVDALRKEDWGFVGAKVVEISIEPVVDNSSAYFRVVCKPESNYLFMGNGMKAELKSGMSFSAKVFVMRRSLFNLIFDSADDWFSNFSVKNGEKI